MLLYVLFVQYLPGLISSFVHHQYIDVIKLKMKDRTSLFCIHIQKEMNLQ